MNNAPLAFTHDKLKDLTTSEMGIIDVKGIEPIPLFFQSGYLTVKSVKYKNL
jgi:hypothetical protein